MSQRLCFIIVLAAGILLACGHRVQAQKALDTNYIGLFPDQLTGRVYLGEKVSVFDVVDKSHSRTLEYRPNNTLGLGLGITIRGIGLNFSTRLPFHDSKEEQYGRTRRYDLQVHRYRGKFAIDGYAQRYKGFHLNSTDDVYGISSGTDYPYFPELTTLNIGAGAMYLFNGNRYSMRGAVNQQDWQLRSAGSFMAGAAFFGRYIFNDESILPPLYKYPDILDGEAVRHISNYGLTFRAGYGYNLVINRHYFIGAAADVGAGPGWSLVRDVAGNERTGWGLNTAANLYIATGYNSPRWFGGVYLILHGDSYRMPYEQSGIRNAQGIFRIAVARRFATGKNFLKSSKGKK